jgi:electron transport complex protein RnfB
MTLASSPSPAATSFADRIDALLPQTQCRRCGFAGCRPYAEAIAVGAADIDRCPPGGERGIARLARLLGVATKPLNPECGAPTPKAIAVIHEAACIGCALCLPACPVDAILGAPRHLHTVITAFCTGCELCLPPCPVDCIAMVAAPERDDENDRARLAAADAARERHLLRLARLAREEEATFVAKAARPDPADDPKRSAVLAAIERARAKAAAGADPERSP